MYDHKKSLADEFESLKSEVKELKRRVIQPQDEKYRDGISNYLEPTNRENEVLKFIEEHPNCTKQEVVDNFKVKLSRTPVYNVIKILSKEGRIRVKPDPKNRQTSRLIVNDTSLLNLVLKELDQIKNDFRRLSEKVLQIAKERRSDGDIMEYFELVAQPYMIFDAIMESYTVRSTIVWPLLLQDEEILRRLIAIVFVRITDILLYHMPQLTPEDTHFSREKFMQRKLQGTISMKTFFSYSKKFGLTEVMDPVLDDLWDINKEIQEYAYPELHLESFRKLESEKNGWRRLVEFAEKHPNEVSMQIPLGWSMNNKNL